MKELSELQKRLYAVFKTPNVDVSIYAMYYAVYLDGIVPKDAIVVTTVRDMQQKLGPVLQRLNAKLEGQRIEPGQLKRTYRLNTKI